MGAKALRLWPLVWLLSWQLMNQQTEAFIGHHRCMAPGKYRLDSSVVVAPGFDHHVDRQGQQQQRKPQLHLPGIQPS